ncbi:unnamed protein product [Protopolystoma xenopodis]|uniref:Uncharacterized protein n=1 Tax=Protopolystoma xenopodis TaxID=117903 RepID=A0A3S5CQQ3_9PLAT|nr:unnamed protein product [Protopolystoma xenopodis]
MTLSSKEVFYTQQTNSRQRFCEASERSAEDNRINNDHLQYRICRPNKIRELERVQKALDLSESRVSSTREELISIRESLKRAQMECELLGHERADAREVAKRSEATVRGLEEKLDRVRTLSRSTVDVCITSLPSWA